MATEAIKKRAPFRRQPKSQGDQILRDRRKFEKQNLEAAQIIIDDPGKVGWCPPILEWAAMTINPPLEDDGEELRIVSE